MRRHGWIRHFVDDFEHNPEFQVKFHLAAMVFWMGNAIVGTGVDLEGMNATCTKCHTQQKGPFVYEHSAMREGCVACHSPHGSNTEGMMKKSPPASIRWLMPSSSRALR